MQHSLLSDGSILVWNMGYGDLVPNDTPWIAFSLLYIFLGLSLTSLSIEILGLIFRRIHYLGSRIEGAKYAKIWVGGKLLTVSDLVRSIGKEAGLSKSRVLSMEKNLDQMLEDAVEEIETRGEISFDKKPIIDDAEYQKRMEEIELRQRKFSGEYDNVPETRPLLSDNEDEKFTLHIPENTRPTPDDDQPPAKPPRPDMLPLSSSFTPADPSVQAHDSPTSREGASTGAGSVPYVDEEVE